MFEKTEAIVLHQLKYDDKKRIITVYSKKFGRTSFIISNTKNLSLNLFRPFNVLELNIKIKKNSNLYRVTDASVLLNYKTVPFSIEKSSIAIFLSELLYKILNEEFANEELFDFIVNSAKTLDETDNNISMFHHIFMIKASKFFGFFPYKEDNLNHPVFNLIDGLFTTNIPNHTSYLIKKEVEIFSNLLNLEYNQSLSITKIEKDELLNNLINYFKIHHESLKDLKSHAVLKEIFS